MKERVREIIEDLEDISCVIQGAWIDPQILSYFVSEEDTASNLITKAEGLLAAAQAPLEELIDMLKEERP